MSALPRRRPHHARRILAAFIPLALAMGLSACGGGSSSSGSKSLTMESVLDSNSLDPFRVSYVAVADDPRMSALYDPMLYIDTTTQTVQPYLAQSLTSADNGTTWTLKLRPGVKFSDGTPFDAAAVKLNWETSAAPATRSLEIAYALGLKLTVVDPLTLSITPAQPNPNFDRTVATHLQYIEAPSALAKGVDSAGANPVGAGPYMLKSWARGSEQVFVKNPNYWQKDKGLPKLDTLTFKNVPDVRQQVDSITKGTADIVDMSDPQQLARGKQELQETEAGTLGGQMWQFNLRKAPFDDPRARKAIALALDPTDLPKTLGNGYIPATGLFNASSPFRDPSIVQPAQDKAQAQALFDQLAAEGKKVDFTFLIPQNPASQQVAEYFQTQLSQFRNVSMKIDSLEISSYITKFAVQHDYQAMLFQQWVADPEPELFVSYLSSSPLNYTGWNNPQADAALVAGRNSTDPAVRKTAYGQFQQQLVNDLPVWVYAESHSGVIAAKNVTGIRMYNAGTPFMAEIGKK